MTVLNQAILDELLDYLEKSIHNLTKGAIENSEFHNNINELEEFISNQFDIRLENLLISKNSSIHHLESGMKNRVIQKKKSILENIKNQSNT